LVDVELQNLWNFVFLIPIQKINERTKYRKKKEFKLGFEERYKREGFF